MPGSGVAYRIPDRSRRSGDNNAGEVDLGQVNRLRLIQPVATPAWLSAPGSAVGSKMSQTAQLILPHCDGSATLVCRSRDAVSSHFVRYSEARQAHVAAA